MEGVEPVIFDGFAHQLPDIDPEETTEWLDSFDAVIDAEGKNRGRFLLMKLLERARELQVGFPATVSTPYVNTLPPDQEPWFPGDEYTERRIRAFIRWNAAVMVTRANTRSEGSGGHLATYASSASLYEVGFNHFFGGKDDGQPGDQVFFQGHASPGIYARAFLEGRLTEDQLDHFRMELGGNGLSSYPHPRLMPDFWEFPTVSMGLGPLNAIYQARFNRYLHHRRIADTSQAKVWAFLGDGECDEPETLGALSLPAREQLDNLIFVVNCNLQRLDGPVRGNGKIIQELEAVFRGAGWNVIKVIWGSKWDELLHQDKDGVLLNKIPKDQPLVLRDRLYLHGEIPKPALDAKIPPYYRPAGGTPEYEYRMERRRALDAPPPRRTYKARPLPAPEPSALEEFLKGSGGQAVSTTMAFARMIRNLMRDKGIGTRVVPIIPDEARTFGMDALFKEFEIYAPFGQKYEPVDAKLLLSYKEDKDGQILEEGITEAGSMADFTAAGTAYATWGQPMIPFFIFYSMFGFQRVGDLIWAFGDIRGKGFLLGA